MRCPSCNLAGAYIRVKTRVIVCNNCGFVGTEAEALEEKKAIKIPEEGISIEQALKEYEEK